MISKKSRTQIREKKHMKLRNRFKGTAERPRLAVYRSNMHMYAQIIDDDAHTTLVSASTEGCKGRTRENKRRCCSCISWQSNR